MTDAERFFGDRVVFYCGDCRDVLAQFDENSIDSCVTDPPYHLVSIVKRFSRATEDDVYRNAELRKTFSQGASPFARQARGFMGQRWDGGDIAFRPEVWAAVYRVLKPGAHLLAFGGTRTYHRMACAIEDAGFEIRDCIQWLYGSGFPKSHDVSKGIDRAAGAEREVIGRKANLHSRGQHVMHDGWHRPWMNDVEAVERGMMETAPTTDAARKWEGWGTALKPAMELVVLARKPLAENTVAANVLKWGTGAINVDGCRIATDELTPRNNSSGEHLYNLGFENKATTVIPSSLGRWPANVIHDGSEEVVGAFPESDHARGNISPTKREQSAGVWAAHGSAYGIGPNGETFAGDSGSAARFFYTAKADSDDRIGSRHPTIKPLDLIQYLVRLITPKGGTCIDPFAGSGTTGEAAWREGMRAVLIETEAEYCIDIRRRMALAMAGPTERTRESIKARNLPRDDGPLFDWKPYDGTDDFARSIDDCYRAVRERKAAGGKGWGGWE